MEVILLDKIDNLGGLGDRVKVRRGYARNYLIPKGKATEATPANIARFEDHRAELERAAAEALSQAQTRKAAVEGVSLTIAAKAGEGGKLFGSIGAGDISHAAGDAGVELERHEIRLPNGPLRALGDHEVEIHLHSDVNAVLKVVVVVEESEDGSGA